jgi:hypothetical protein
LTTFVTSFWLRRDFRSFTPVLARDGFVRSTSRTQINIEKDHLIPIMKTSPMNRSHSAALLALALGLAAASSVEAATTAYTWNTNPGAQAVLGSFSATVQTMMGEMPGVAFSGKTNLWAGAGNGGFWTRGGDIQVNYTSQFALYSEGGSLYPYYGAVEGTNNYALFETSDQAMRFVVQVDLTGTTAVPVAWAQSDISGFNIAAGKTAIDALSTSAVPEASTSLGLLALGAGGVLTRRRFKRAA